VDYSEVDFKVMIRTPMKGGETNPVGQQGKFL
jgi:hypothetical protein